jgi:hypothetical protein
MPRIRAAETGDLAAIIAMTRTARRKLAEWSPVFFRPHPNADERHAEFLLYMVRSPSHETRVAVTDAGTVAAFGVVHQQTGQYWLDDLCVADPRDWLLAGAALIASVEQRPTVSLVSPQDHDRLAALRAAGYAGASSYWSRILTEHVDAQAATSISSGDPERIPAEQGPIHAFGGALDPAAPLALALSTEDGYVVGSPSATPPIYDPGGTTCVIDRIVGSRRRQLLIAATAAAARRGDHQVLVVAADGDDELLELLRANGFARQMLVFAAGL